MAREHPALKNEGNHLASVEKHASDVYASKERVIGWLAASVAAFNAAGLALGVSYISGLQRPALILTCYLLTLSLCFLTGVLYVDGTSSSLNVTYTWIRQLKLPVSERNVRVFNEALEAYNGNTRTLEPAIICGLITFAFTIASPAILGHDIWEGHAVNQRRCLAVQRDMLSARPRRSDGPDLFQALGCRPQGQGSVYAPGTPGKPVHLPALSAR